VLSALCRAAILLRSIDEAIEEFVRVNDFPLEKGSSRSDGVILTGTGGEACFLEPAPRSDKWN